MHFNDAVFCKKLNSNKKIRNASKIHYMHQHHEWQKILIVKKKLWNLINNGGHDLLIFLNFPWLFICKFIKGKTSWKLENIKNSYKSEPNCSKVLFFVQKNNFWHFRHFSIFQFLAKVGRYKFLKNQIMNSWAKN